MPQFHQVGRITRAAHALRVDLDGWQLGTLVIGAREVQGLLQGRTVDVSFVQQRDGGEPFVGHAGTAKISKSGKAANVRIEGRPMTAPLRQIRSVLAGDQHAALLPQPAPVIDADTVQRKNINAGLPVGF